MKLFVNYGLEGWWKLDESSGSASDSSGKSHTGTLTNGPTWSSTGGILNGALTFDGQDSYVSVPSTTSLKYTGAELTLSTWVYVNSTETNGAYLISKPWNGVSDAYNYQLGFNSGTSTTTGTVFFSLQGSSPSGAYSIATSSGISTGAWHQITATVDSSKAMKLYIDGVLAVSGTHNITAWTPTDGSKPLVIGSKWTYSAGSYGSSTLDGKMDNVQVYTHTLSAEAIANQARCPVGFWKFDETSGGTAYDSTSNAYNGTLSNGPTWNTAGEFNGSLLFDGTDSYVSGPTATAVKYKGAELTLSTWVYVYATETDGAYLISKPWNTSTGQFNYGLSINGSRILSFSLQGTSTSYTLSAASAISAGAWHHVAATVDGSKAVKLYIDGVLVNSGTHTITAWAPTDSSKPLVIGSKWTYSAGNYSSTTLDGKLDNVRLYDKALSSDDIHRLAIDPPQAAKATPIVSLIASAADAVFANSANITIKANASDADGRIVKVDFYEDGTLLGTDTTAPYSWTWKNAPLGVHNLTAVATDNDLLTTISRATSIKVFSRQNINTTSGSGSCNSGVYTMNARGTGITGTSDGFRFLYTSVTGDFTMTARVASFNGTAPMPRRD